MISRILGYNKSYGLFRSIWIFFMIKFNRKGKIKMPDVKYPFLIRPKTADKYTVYDIFGLKGYDIDLPFEPEFIIDGGANIGLTSIFFANKYPNANIISVEPEENNFQLLQKNTILYPNVKVIKNAIWRRKSFLIIKDNGYGIRGFQVEEVNEFEEYLFDGISITDILNENKKSVIDILKLDIEGSEKYIFEKSYEKWLPNVKCLIIEIHDFMLKGCSRAVLNAISKYNFSLKIRGENLIFINDDLVNLKSFEN